MADLESAISALNYNKIKSLAHAAKGSSASSGAAYVSELFKQIELNNQDIDLAARNIEHIKTELTQIEQQLNTLGIL
ncbi:Hpt domain-containing protein [Vibrio cholerae]